MAQNHTASSALEPEAATDEPAFPTFTCPEEEDAFWKGVSHGIRTAGREPGHPHMPADFDLDLTRDGASPALVSSRLLEPWPDPASLKPAYPAARASRPDGWNPDKERRFLETLAETGVVADACRASGMSRDAAYRQRRRASGRGFALGWDAALLIARGRVSDDVMSRAIHGVIERVYRNGELVGERHRYDNRLTMAVLTRLDRQADGLGENAPVARCVAGEFDRFLDLLPQGVEGAKSFLAARFPDPPPACLGEVAAQRADGGACTASEIPTETTLLARLAAYEQHGVGLPAEVSLEDLDPTDMERWTDDQWARADFSGHLETLPESAWPEAARDPVQAEANGMCKLRKLYLRHHPPAPPEAVPDEAEAEDDFAGCSVWEEDGEWLTDFPPPDGFDGWEEGDPDDAEHYRRALTEEELAAIGADPESEEEDRAEWLAERQAARDRYFGFDPSADNSEEEQRGEDHPDGGSD